MLSPLTLDRLHDSEMHVAADQDALTTPELFDRLSKSIFAEVEKAPEGEFTNRKPAISSLRRNLQRTYLKRLRRTGRPIVLTLNGHAELVVLSASAYERRAKGAAAGSTGARGRANRSRT